jgi:hypothetical protein
VIQLSLAIFGKNFLGSRGPNCISTLSIIHKLMDKLKLSTSVWKHICSVFHPTEKLSGLSGYPFLNGGTTHLTILPLTWPPLKQSTRKNHQWFSHTCMVSLRFKKLKSLLYSTNPFSVPWKKIWSWLRITWSNKQIRDVKNTNLMKGTRCFFVCNLINKIH